MILKKTLLYKITNNLIRKFIKDIKKKKNIKYIKKINIKYLNILKIYYIFIKKINCIDKKKKINLLISIIKNKIKNIFYKLKNNIIKIENKKNININIKSPSIKNIIGSLHPINIIIKKIKYFFYKKNYILFNTNEIENYIYNFDLLNIPIDHISRNKNNTFWINKNYLLRTHTSNSQIRYLNINKNNNIPIKIFSYGKVYRNDNKDKTHLQMFHQLDVFNINKDINIKNLMETIYEFIYYIFNKKMKLKIRNSYFPFTEPSFEIDIFFNNKWIELLGCGLIHSNIIKNTNLKNKKEIGGFAFGVGIERLLMIKYNIKDVKNIYYNDIRFINKFKNS
ncbi:phenylalanine--tRNA ligase subunit alpha [Candidatus Nardonella dryophthoridicola]|uniref:phenylalanine--tRNA ligase n=1 Tax=endosymbiont of Rhynchophorus ferrugineus TaxID=1972133 RepID=A0A2Z5TPY1_9GAMM|nr:phenylalanine--tRNA ligase subunit alpha [Candidatus Nardonella dryophthoridicola]BBA85124.1 phenylalanine--tRNA ligase alpha subunit [endosymbiont of Rhynchophorus ferrugineus]